MNSLYLQSLRIIKEGQSGSGAYIACPNFPTYNYCWLRDGSFIAHAMDTAGDFGSSDAFFRWVGRTIQKYSAKVEDIRHSLETGLPIGKDDVLHTRFSLDGEEVTEDSAWGNFQIDGYGTWLWALSEHVRLSRNDSILDDLDGPIQTTLRYLELVWQLPNYDCWEEYPEYLHPYSLATIYAGLSSIVNLTKLHSEKINYQKIQKLADQIKAFVLKYGIEQGKFVKFISPTYQNKKPTPVIQSGIDSSLIGIAIPFQLLSPNDPRMVETINSIEANLHRQGGGVYRYKADVYYGGGEWILLSAWLGWYYASIKKYEKANELRIWIESHADSNGCLAEQISEYSLAPQHFDPWVKKWGPVATPLIWSHAMYVILVNALKGETVYE